MTLDDRLDSIWNDAKNDPLEEAYGFTMKEVKQAILTDLLELVPDNVDTKQYRCDDSEYSFMLGYIQACIEIEDKVRKYCD